MTDSVQVGVSSGEALTWSNATFAWNSTTAAKLWSASTRTQHDVRVAVACSISDQRKFIGTWRRFETITTQDFTARQLQIRRADAIDVAHGLTQAVSFVRHWAEAINTTDGHLTQSMKRWAVPLQLVDGNKGALQKELTDQIDL